MLWSRRYTSSTHEVPVQQPIGRRRALGGSGLSQITIRRRLVGGCAPSLKADSPTMRKLARVGLSLEPTMVARGEAFRCVNAFSVK